MKPPILIALALLTLGGCSKKAAEPDSIARRDEVWVSIGTLDADDERRRVEFFSFLTTLQVACYPEGWPACQVMVRTGDVERVQAYLRTNSFADPAFHPIWTNQSALSK